MKNEFPTSKEFPTTEKNAKNTKRWSVNNKDLIYLLSLSGLLVAVSVVFIYIQKFFPAMPQGGTLRLVCIPLLLTAFLFPWYVSFIVSNILVGFAILLNPSGVISPWQVFLDWYFPYTAMTLACIWTKLKINHYIFHILVPMSVAYFSTVVSGVIFYGSYAWSGFNSQAGIWAYSFLYNGIYYLPSIVLIYCVMWPIYKTMSRFQNKHLFLKIK